MLLQRKLSWLQFAIETERRVSRRDKKFMEGRKERTKGKKETEEMTVKVTHCQKCNIFSTGLTETRVFLGMKKKNNTLANTCGYRYQTDGWHAELCCKKLKHSVLCNSFTDFFYPRHSFFHAFIHFAKHFKPTMLFTLFVWIAIFIIFSVDHMQRKQIFPTETRFLMYDPTIPPLFSSLHFRPSVKGNNQAPLVDHTSTSATQRERGRVRKRTFSKGLQRCSNNTETQKAREMSSCLLQSSKTETENYNRTFSTDSIHTYLHHWLTQNNMQVQIWCTPLVLTHLLYCSPLYLPTHALGR